MTAGGAPKLLTNLRPALDRLPARLFRERCRAKAWTGPTSGVAPNFHQANLVVMPTRALAFDFLLFCLRNPKPCPILEVCESPFPVITAKDADLRTDLPRYRIYHDGVAVDEPLDLLSEWPFNNNRDDDDSPVAFLLGCSFSFEHELRRHGLLLPSSRVVAEAASDANASRSVPMYITRIRNARSRHFEGNLVVSYRKFDRRHAQTVIDVTSRNELAHGAPIYVGNDYEAELGIQLTRPDFGDAVSSLDVPRPDQEVAMFWACGVTPQVAIAQAKLPRRIATHSPGHMFVTDLAVV